MILNRCLICGSFIGRGHGLCGKCFSELKEYFLDSYMVRCPKCFYPLLGGEYNCPKCRYPVYCISDYSSPLPKSVLFKYKFDNCKILASDIAQIYKLFIPLVCDNPIIVPVPCSAKSLNRRGWDHMQEVAVRLGYETSFVIRNNSSNEQKLLNRQQRIDASVGKYSLVGDLPKDRNILVIDDVATTFSTIYSCIQLFDRPNVYGLTWFIDL